MTMEIGTGLLAPLGAAARRARIVLPLGALALVLAACNRVDTGTVGFWDIIWSMVILFFWIMYIWIWISIFMDIFRRNDISGGMKAIWIVALFFFQFITILVYIVTRPKVTAQDVQMIAQAEAANKAASQVSTADELAKLQQLKDAGTINDAQFEELKKKLMS